MPAPSPSLYPSLSLFPGPVIGPVIDGSGNPTGFDESGWWSGVDNTRPDGLQWLAVDLLSGSIICDLPTIVSWDPTRRTLGKYESLTAMLVVTAQTSPGWLQGTRPMGTALIAYRGDPGSEVIYWGGVVLRRQRSHGGNTVALTLATPECYLDRRYTGAYTTDPTNIGARADQNVIITTLVNNFAVAGSGLPITVVTVSNGQPVPTQYAVYNDYDDRTVYSNLGTLNAYLNGPEWTGHWQWNRATNKIRPVLYVGNHIGMPTPAGLAPRAVFDSANLAAGTLDENYSTAMGATKVTATSSGQGLARPSATAAATSTGRPTVEYRYQPQTSIQDPLTLSQHATRALGLLAEGTNTITLQAALATAPPFGSSWDIGDDVGYILTGPAFPGDFTGTGRAIGYQADDTFITPTLYIPQVI